MFERGTPVKQCAVLYMNSNGKRSSHPSYLRALGFVVHEVTDWPQKDGAAREYHVIVVNVSNVDDAPMLAARLRAKPHFGRRLLIALVDRDTPVQVRRAAAASGFDEVLNDSCDGRLLTARILRGIRGRSELRCALPPSTTRRSAA